MAEHEKQMAHACCNQQELVEILQVHPAVPFPTPCPLPCAFRQNAENLLPPQQFIPGPQTGHELGETRYATMTGHEGAEDVGYGVPHGGGYDQNGFRNAVQITGSPEFTHQSVSDWMPWSPWSSCSVSCDVGVQKRWRECKGEGTCYGDNMQQQPCEMPPCKMWSDWCEWSPCKASCGIGERVRTRYCELGNLRCEGPDFEVEKCDAGVCPQWTPWQEWSRCSVTCGGGVMQRSRFCQSGYCPGNSVEEMKCGMEPCPYWSEWSPFSKCSVSCGNDGVMIRYRTCSQGQLCPGESTEEMPCQNMPPCAHWTEWDDWSQCSVSCGHGILTRQRSCIGMFCQGAAIEQVPCNLPQCAFWAQWQEWTSCSVSCGEGVKYRRRICQYGTECEGHAEEQMPCKERPCCHWSEWHPWSKCDRPCDGGRMNRERKCLRDGDGEIAGGECICHGTNHEFRICNMQRCIPVCHWTPWCPWSSCSAVEPCTTGIITRSRQCVGDAGCNCYGFADETHSCRSKCPHPQILPTIPQQPCSHQPTPPSSCH